MKCFAKAGVCPLDEEEKEDPDDDVPLVLLLVLATERLSLEQPLDIDEFLTLDDDVPATEELHDGWEVELAQEHDTMEEVEDIEEEDSTDHPKPNELDWGTWSCCWPNFILHWERLWQDITTFLYWTRAATENRSGSKV